MWVATAARPPATVRRYALHPPPSGARPSLGARDGVTVVAFRRPDGAPPLPAGAEIDRGHVRFRTETPTRDLAPLLAWAAERELELEGLTVTRPTLEDVYLELTEEPAA